MGKFSDSKGGGIHGYAAPDLVLTVIAVESGFAASEVFYDSQEGVTNQDYVWGGTLDGEYGEFE